MPMKSNTVNIKQSGGVMYISFPRLEATGAVRHLFSTRIGGVSEGQFATMNTRFTGDKREHVEENYRRLCAAVGIDTENLVLSHQTHTNNVKIVDKSHCGTGYSKPSFCDVDGLITATQGVALVTQYADCTPLLFCDPVQRVCATSHAGWRGTASKIGEVTVEKMVSEFGSRREDIVAAIGPSICKTCYEVDTPVYDAFVKSGINLEGVVFPKGDGEHFNLDLKRANLNILLSSGIPRENIDVADLCTFCNSDTLHSHRATGGKRGNLAAIIELI